MLLQHAGETRRGPRRQFSSARDLFETRNKGLVSPGMERMNAGRFGSVAMRLPVVQQARAIVVEGDGRFQRRGLAFDFGAVAPGAVEMGTVFFDLQQPAPGLRPVRRRIAPGPPAGHVGERLACGLRLPAELFAHGLALAALPEPGHDLAAPRRFRLLLFEDARDRSRRRAGQVPACGKSPEPCDDLLMPLHVERQQARLFGARLMRPPGRELRPELLPLRHPDRRVLADRLQR